MIATAAALSTCTLLSACVWDEAWPAKEAALSPPEALMGQWQTNPLGDAPTQFLTINAAEKNTLNLQFLDGDKPAQHWIGWLGEQNDLPVFCIQTEPKAGDENGAPQYFIGTWTLQDDTLTIALATDAEQPNPPYTKPQQWLETHAEELQQKLTDPSQSLSFFRDPHPTETSTPTE